MLKIDRVTLFNFAVSSQEFVLRSILISRCSQRLSRRDILLVNNMKVSMLDTIIRRMDAWKENYQRWSRFPIKWLRGATKEGVVEEVLVQLMADININGNGVTGVGMFPMIDSDRLLTLGASDEMKKFTTIIVDMMRFENEFGNMMRSYGQNGKELTHVIVSTVTNNIPTARTNQKCGPRIGLAGSQYATYGKYSFIFEADIKLKLGKNEVSLISGTVGLPVGMHGENMKLYSPGITEGWFANGLPTDKIFMWYKTTFRTPIGTDPVVLDLKGSGKGQAWVNGNNIGRYWTSYLAGTMSQTHFFVMVRITHWFCLKNPFEVKIASVTIAKACAKAYEGHALELACKENQVISEIKFASFGVPKVNVDPLRRVIVNLVILYLM
ncbi:hypothetical protein JHK87_045337 [Glycine soja]|nr:hypothetical protein JHK87_045337 [Glycine soja]